MCFFSSLKRESVYARHLYLIRHGQYFDNARTLQEMKLTELGKEQLVYTGRRLNEMKVPFDRLIHSGMVRAVESAGILNEQLDSKLVMFEDKNLTEGLPVAPIPYAGISQHDVDVRKPTNRRIAFLRTTVPRYMAIEQGSILHLQPIFIEHVVIKPKKHMIFSSFMPIFYVISFASRFSKTIFIELLFSIH